MNCLIFTFWISVIAIAYAYAGYSLLLVIISKLKGDSISKQNIYPLVSIIIAAHNEEAGIRDKLINTLNLDYPRDKLEVIVASDASTDKTNEIVSSFDNIRVKLLAFSEHNGKTFVQNEAVKQARGEIIVFSDATTAYDKQVLKKLARNFADSRVGAVGGELMYVNKRNTSVGDGNGLYWEYEKFLKKRESQVSSLIGVSGCCYAVKKEFYEPIGPDLISDFVIAQMIYKRGKKVVYEPDAISYEETTSTSKDEFGMRVRVCLRTLHGLWRMKSLLNPFKYGFFAVQLISHKLFRYSVPIFMVILLLSNIMIVMQSTDIFYKVILVMQAVFYFLALVGVLTRRKKHNLLVYVPFYFCVTNFALFIGIIEFLRGKKMVVWKPIRSSKKPESTPGVE